MLLVGAMFVISGVASHHSQEWYSATTYYKHRMFSLGLWATGAFTIGIGVIPLIGGLASLWRMPDEQPTREIRAYRSVALAGILAVGFYTFLKAAYLSTVFATRVEERNIIYIAPLLFIGTALVLERRRVNPYALAAATVLAMWVLVTTPYQMGVQLYSDALGLAILQQANRFLLWTPFFAQWLMLAIAAVGSAALLGMRYIPDRGRAAAVVVGILGVFVVGWNLTGEIAAAAGTNSISRESAATLGKPYDWVDRIAHRQPTLYLGQGVADQNGEWLLEFWNRSITAVGSLDGTVGGPGPAGGPNIAADGTTYWTADPKNPGQEYAYAVEEWPCVDFAGTLAAKHDYRAGGSFGGGRWRLIRLTHPNRLRAECTGISPDGWTGSSSGYNRFSNGNNGHIVVTVSRANGGPTTPTPIHILIGSLTVDANHQPQLGRVIKEKTDTIAAPQTKTFTLPAPSSRFAVRVVVDQLFVPHDLNPSRRRRPSARRGCDLPLRARAPGGAQVGEARAEHEPRQRPGALRCSKTKPQRPRKSVGLRNEERSNGEPVEARGAQVGANLREPVLARVQVEDELRLGVAGDPREQRAPVPGVVDRPEDRRRLHRLLRLEVVQIRLHDVTAASTCGGDHLRARVDAEVAILRQEVAEAAVAAREIDDGIARPQALGRVSETRRRAAQDRSWSRRTPRHSSCRRRRRTCPTTRSSREQSLGMLAEEARHRARVPERVPGEEALVDHGRVLVVHDRGRDVPALPPGLRGAVVEVDVLAVHPVAGVPAADLVEHRAAQQEEGAEHRVCFHGLVGPLVEQVVAALPFERREQLPQRRPPDERAADGRKAAARRLPRAVAVEHLRTADTGARMLFHERAQNRDRIRLRHGVRVRDQDELVLRVRGAEIRVRGE